MRACCLAPGDREREREKESEREVWGSHLLAEVLCGGNVVQHRVCEVRLLPGEAKTNVRSLLLPWAPEPKPGKRNSQTQTARPASYDRGRQRERCGCLTFWRRFFAAEMSFNTVSVKCAYDKITCRAPSQKSFEQRGHKDFEGFHLKATARIWPWLSYMCHICSTGPGPCL